MRAILFCLALLALGAHSAKAETFADVNRILDKEYGWQFKSVPAAVQGMDFNCNFQNRKPSGSVQFSPICVGNKTGLRLIVLWRSPTVSPNVVHQNITSTMNRNGTIAGGDVTCTARDVRPAVVAARCLVPFNDSGAGNAAFLHMSLVLADGKILDFSIIVQNTGSGRQAVDPVDPMS